MPTQHFRAHQRFAVRLPVTVTSRHRPVASKGSTVDLGIGGGAFELDTPLRLGEPVEVRIDGVIQIRLPAAVAWVGWGEASAVRLGVRFDPMQTTGIAQLMETLGVTANAG